MIIDFRKYQGAGNDFVIIDGFREDYLDLDLSTAQVRTLCHRQFGIGADGLIILRAHPECDFEMVYYNSDGRLSSMCGNGGRCSIKLAVALGHAQEDCSFMAADGIHLGKSKASVELKMSPVPQIESITKDSYFLDTGSPHYVQFVEDLDSLDLLTEARAIRYNERFKAEGTNVNFVQVKAENHLAIRTYERGVEDETLACGTGIVAASLAYDSSSHEHNTIKVEARGGDCEVKFTRADKGWEDIWLIGPAEEVFAGVVDLNSLVLVPDSF